MMPNLNLKPRRSEQCIALVPPRSNDVFDGMTGVDRSNKPESVVALLGGNARLVFGLATALLLAGGGLLFWLLQSAVRQPARGRCLGGGCAPNVCSPVPSRCLQVQASAALCCRP